MRVGLKILTLIASIAGIHLLMTQPGAAGDKEIILSVPSIPGPYCAYGVEKRLLELADKGSVLAKLFDCTVLRICYVEETVPPSETHRVI